jgi:antitoxin ParD1/3/4
MEITLTESQEDFVKHAIREGRFSSESDVFDLAIRLVQAREEKLDALRAMIQTSLKDPREVSEDEMDAAIEAKSQELLSLGIPW